MLRRLGVRGTIAVFLGLPILVLGAGVAAYQGLFGEGDLVFVAPFSGSLTFDIDGHPQTLKAGDHRRVKAKQGKHQVKLSTDEGDVSRTVEVKNGFAELLVPGTGQCFVVLDVSRSNYKFDDKPADKLPTLKERIGADQITDLPGALYYSDEELPQSIKENASCNLLLRVDCGMLKLSDTELLTALTSDSDE